MSDFQTPLVPAPKFTIITSTYNAGADLLITAQSLREQTYDNFEWIIADGASRDDTIEVAKGLGDLVTRLVSEPDNGVYSAWNKVLPMVTGDWVIFLGAGDSLVDADVLRRVRDKILCAPSRATTLYGSVLELEGPDDNVGTLRIGVWIGVDGLWADGRPMVPGHQGVFHKAELFRAGFRFNDKQKICADYELMLRELLAGNGHDLGMVVARFQDGGISSQAKNQLRVVAETVAINMRIGIFHKRPVYQILVVARNAAKHVFRVLGSKGA